ncbi:MAG: purine-binding chemotaxis protein CheW [Peptococcaceae bacterium]|jgi:purine-binding chemotaxis protein CheW|nr:purine-binding chemotaxis protein CheW [Peptococcaceae bacterium]
MDLQTVIFTLGNEEYGLPVQSVQEITLLENIHPIPQAPTYIQGLINIRGQALPIVDLHRKFDLQNIASNSLVIIVEINDNLIGLAVDEVKEIRTFEKIEPRPYLVTVPFINGIINLEDRMIIMLNPQSLLEDQEIKELMELVEN